MNIRRSCIFVLSGCALLLLAGCHGRKAQAGIPGGSDPYDERFLIWLVSHHNDDDRMVGPCAKNDTIRIELRDFCTNVDKQHRESVDRMREWLKDWYGAELPRTDNIPLWLGTLKGQEFEREFFKEYEHQHADGAESIKECSSKATHAELRELCHRIAPGNKSKANSCDNGAVSGSRIAIDS